MTSPAFDHFVSEQDAVYARVLGELDRGRKESHWMWFIFPQLAGLGKSPDSVRYAISSLDDARAYLAHPILGPRLRECTAAVNAIGGRTLQQIFGATDAMKFRSCMTLFAAAAPDAPFFTGALNKYCDGNADPMTLQLLQPTS